MDYDGMSIGTLTINEAHLLAAIEVVGLTTARASGRHHEWVKRRMREASRFLMDPANDADSALRREYIALMRPVFEMAVLDTAADPEPSLH